MQYHNNIFISSWFMRKFLAVICLTIFTIQLLPLRAIGKMLWNGQMTEEVHECSAHHKKMNTNDHDKFWYLYLTAPLGVSEIAPCYRHALRDEALIKCMHLDVPLQPPNFQ